MLDQRHERYRLAGKIDWSMVEERFERLYSDEGRPAIPIRLMVGLHYLKHTFNESDETVVKRWPAHRHALASFAIGLRFPSHTRPTVSR